MQAALRFRRPHRGQRRVRDSKSRHRTVRCGRRWGKTRFGIIETCELSVAKTSKIGWFVAQEKYIDEVWLELKQRLAPLITKRDDSKHRLELANGSVIEVWTFSGKNGPEAGRGRDYDLIIVDEAGIVPGLRRWWDAVAEATLIDRSGRALFLSTPNVIGPDFDSFFEQAGSPGWEDWEAFTGQTFDNEYLPPIELDKIRKKRKVMPDWLWLQEYMGIPADGAQGFFGRKMLNKHRTIYGLDPIRRLSIDAPDSHDREFIIMRGDISKLRILDDPEKGVWKLWRDYDAENPPDPDQRYGLAADIGAGVGSSNTVFTVVEIDTGDKIAEFVSPLVGAEKAAELAMMAGFWFRGRDGPAMICPETNGGQGEAFAKCLMRNNYPAVFGEKIGEARRDARSGHTEPRVGWRSSPTAKVALFEALRGAMASGKFHNPSHAAIDEALTYSFDKAGKLVPFSRDADPMEDIARMPHGDRVVADAIAVHIIEHAGKMKMKHEQEFPPGSDAARIAKRYKLTAKKPRKTKYGW